MNPMQQSATSIHLRLPATSANIGPAFDTAAVALDLHLELSAEPAESFSIDAKGRDAVGCGKVEGNLILDTYRWVLTQNGRPIQSLHLQVNNEIPLGMGCGSSAAARLAGIALAVEFGKLQWSENEILAVATFLEGHPDNVSACWLGGMTVSAVNSKAQQTDNREQPKYPQVYAARFDVPEHWRAVMVLPRVPIGTQESRKVLPEQYHRADVIENLQHSSLLVAAFASANGRLLHAAMHDTLHQPYRSRICPLLGRLLPLRTVSGVLGVALSGAGPGTLLIVEREMEEECLNQSISQLLRDQIDVEVIQCGFMSRGAKHVADKIYV